MPREWAGGIVFTYKILLLALLMRSFTYMTVIGVLPGTSFAVSKPSL